MNLRTYRIDLAEWQRMVGGHSALETLRIAADGLALPDVELGRIHHCLMELARERHRLRLENQMLRQRMDRIGNALERAARLHMSTRGTVVRWRTTISRYAKLATESTRQPLIALRRELGKHVFIP